MTLRERLISLLGGSAETKQLPSLGGSGASVAYQTVGSGYINRSSYSDFAEEGYAQNAIVYRCVNEIAQGAAAIPFNVKSDGEAFEQHPLISLLNRPNPLQAHNEYFQSLYSYLLISGNSYALKVKTENQGVRELHLFRPDRMNVVPSDNYIPKGYEYKIQGRVVTTYDADPESGMSEVKHFKLWSPLNDYYGLSPIYAASADIDLHNLVARHNVNLLNNGARPTGAVVFNPKDQKSGLSVQLTPDQRRQVQHDLNSRFSGAENSGRTMLLEGDFDWKEMGLSPKDMDFLNAKNMSARDIALCFGVPSQLVGVPDSQTYANVAEARLALYEETIIPLARRIESDFNEWLVPEYGDDRLTFEYDIDEIPAIAERRRRVYENVIQGVREGIISRNEARDRIGLGEVEGGDDVYIAANLFPLGSTNKSVIDEEGPAVAPKDEMYDELIGREFKLDEYPDGEKVPDNLPSAYALAEGSENCGNCAHLEAGDYCSHWDAEVRRSYWCKAWKSNEEKAELAIDLKPTQEMAEEAVQALEWRKEFNRGGTEVGVARAVQLKNRENLSEDTVKRMHSFFSRHEVDKQAEGFSRGEDGFPSAGRIAWGLWGGDAGQKWARRKTAEIDREKSELDLIEVLVSGDYENEHKVEISEQVREALRKKVDDHNEQYGRSKSKRVTLRMLTAVFRRGIGAYNTNPSSVRPSVSNADQWAYARVNVFLRAVRTGKFKSGKFDTDLLPEGHPLSSKK